MLESNGSDYVCQQCISRASHSVLYLCFIRILTPYGLVGHVFLRLYDAMTFGVRVQVQKASERDTRPKDTLASINARLFGLGRLDTTL